MMDSRAPSGAGDDEDVKCIGSRVMVPGDAVMLHMRLTVLRFAQERRWVFTGGWSQHAFLRSVDPALSLYNSHRPCKMSDVDALCVDPLGDLIELASRLHRDTGVALMVGCGMMPNIFHLKLNWGGESLVDAVGVDAATLATVPTRTYPMSLLLGAQPKATTAATQPKATTGAVTQRKTFRVLDPSYELSRMYMIVDSAFQAQNTDLAKRLSRLAMLETALFPGAPHRARTTTTSKRPPRSPLYDSLRAAGMGSLVARVPGTPEPELMVPSADAIAVLGVVVREAARLDPQGATLAFYSPFIWTNNYALVAEISVASTVMLRMFVAPMPVPLARRSTATKSSAARTIAYMSSGTATTHLLLTAYWRHRLGDADGARRRAASAYEIMAGLVGVAKSPAVTYAGSLPATHIFQRYIRRRSQSQGCMAKYVTPGDAPKNETARQQAVEDAVAQAKRSPGARLVLFDGRLLATHPCAALAGAREALVAAVVAVTDNNVMSDPMLPKREFVKKPFDGKRHDGKRLEGKRHDGKRLDGKNNKKRLDGKKNKQRPASKR